MVKRTSRALLACLILASAAQGQAQGPKVGMKVVTRYTRPLRVDERVVDDGSTFRVYTVDRLDGESVRLVSGSVGGWVAASDVLPLDEAIDFYTAEIRDNPDNAAAYNWRGLLWREKGEQAIAIADFDEVIRINPNDATAYNNRGNARMARREFDRAIADYDQAIRLRPGHTMAYNNRGNARMARKDHDGAIADYEEAIRIDPDYAPAYNNRGNALRAKNEFDRALADFDEAIRLDPRSAMAYNNRGSAWRAKEQYDRALADFDEAIRIDPSFVNGHNRRAWLRATCPDAGFRDGKKAIEAARRACELSDWKNPDYLDTLAAAHAEAGVFDQAVRWQQEAVRRKPAADDEAQAFRDRLALYRDKKPYREP